MMRSLFSGVSGLKVHQTKMDVIGNNIANVNTVGFKSSTVNFSDILYQNVQSASGPNSDTGKAGQNAKQIGLGTNLASITTKITGTGGSQRTDNPFDVMINGDAFFIVNQGGQNYFTKAGAFKVDAAGNLCTSSGAKVMGWQVNEEGTAIVQDTVSPLRLMSPENMYAAPEATTNAYIAGNIDEKDPNLATEKGVPVQINFYDKLGNSYNAKLSIQLNPEIEGSFKVSLTDIVDSNNQSIFVKQDTGDDVAGNSVSYSLLDGVTVKLGETEYTISDKQDENGASLTEKYGQISMSEGAEIIAFDPSTGKYKYAGAEAESGDKEEKWRYLDLTITMPTDENGVGKFETIKVDFSSLTKYATSDKCSLEPYRGTVEDGAGAGRKVGEMTGLSVDTAGKIYGSYDNGTKRLLGQIAVATFPNPAGLEAVGDSMFATTQNSGDFNGIGQDPSANGNSLTTGVLEMSNVDLSEEFTTMITTQRGFQANSRIITTSDTLLEELINLKR